MISVKTHGKLYIAGEYQVLNTGGNAILLGLNKGITFNIKRAESFSYISRNVSYDFIKDKNKVIFNNHHNKLVEKTFETIFAYLNSLEIPIKPFNLEIISKLESSSQIKYGFGSSSAVISGIIKAVSKYHNVNLSNKALFKLSVLSQISLGEISSGGDIAAAIYGSWIYYERYDLDFVVNNIGKIDLVTESWPNLIIKQLDVNNINIIAAWTKLAYKTKPLSKKISNRKNQKAYNMVKSLKSILQTSNIKAVSKDIKAYDKWLKRVLRKSGRYTEKLALAIKIANKYKLAAKISGAGGGDSAIIVYNNQTDTARLCNELNTNNIETFKF